MTAEHLIWLAIGIAWGWYVSLVVQRWRTERAERARAPRAKASRKGDR